MLMYDVDVRDEALTKLLGTPSISMNYSLWSDSEITLNIGYSMFISYRAICKNCVNVVFCEGQKNKKKSKTYKQTSQWCVCRQQYQQVPKSFILETWTKKKIPVIQFFLDVYWWWHLETGCWDIWFSILLNFFLVCLQK